MTYEKIKLSDGLISKYKNIAIDISVLKKTLHFLSEHKYTFLF